MKKVDVFSIQIIAKYLQTNSDFLNIIQICKKFRYVLDRFRENPIALSLDNKKLFQCIETQVFYTPFDYSLPGLNLHVYLYRVSYSEYKKKSSQYEIYKSVTYTKEDVDNYGVLIPKEVNSISSKAFSKEDDDFDDDQDEEKNDSIKTIIIPKNVTELYESAFEDCTFESIELPDTIRYIGNNAFSSCGNLKEMVLPETLKVIPNECFYFCKLTKIDLPKSLQCIGEGAFISCHIKEITIPENCELKSECFNGCMMLSFISLKGQKRIPNGLCKDCDNLIKIEIDDNLVSIGNEAFSRCEKLQDLNFSENLEFIGDQAFEWCFNFKEIVLKEKVNYVGKCAFFFCSNLEEIYVKNKNTLIGLGAFNCCNKLTKIEIPNLEHKCQHGMMQMTKEEFEMYSKTYKNVDNDSVELCLCNDRNVGPEEQIDFNKITSIYNYDNFLIKNLDLGTTLEQIEDRGLNVPISSLFIPSTVALCNKDCVNSNNLKYFVMPKYSTTICKEAITINRFNKIAFAKSTTKIGKKTFNYCNFKSIEICNGITEIEDCAFCECGNLEEIVIPSSVTKITENFVVACSSLSSIKFENNSILDISRVIEKNQLFSEDITEIPIWLDELTNSLNFEESLTKIVVPNSVTKIDNYMFSGEPNLVELSLPGNIKKIGKHIFSDNDNKMTKIDIGNNTKEEFDKYVVNYACHLRLLNFGYHFDNIEFNIDDYERFGNVFDSKIVTKYEQTKAFNNTVFDYIPKFVAKYSDLNIKSESLVFPKEITEIVNESCQNMKITFVEIPNIEIISREAFSKCYYLTQLVFSKNLKEIKKFAFSECVSLEEISLPNSLQKVGEGAFKGCSRLEKVICENENVIYGRSCFMKCVSLKKVPIIRHIATAMFFECKSLEKIFLIEKCEEICEFAFYKCFSLSKIDIPKSVTKIGAFAFRKCLSLTTFEIPENVLCLGDGAFYDCKNLEKVVSKNTNILGKCDLFEGCESLRIFEFGQDYTKYQFEVSYSFSVHMKKLNICCENVVIKRSDVLLYGTTKMLNEMKTNKFIRRIDEGAFYNNTEVTKIVIPEQITDIGIYAFYKCGNLKEIVISKSIDNIPEFCFAGCTNLEIVKIEGNVTTFRFCCFSNCDKLNKQIEAPEECYETLPGDENEPQDDEDEEYNYENYNNEEFNDQQLDDSDENDNLDDN
ncbi:hypothetical protein EIN_289480 [Entamoeba invadens IP1]|uniref:Kazal-like domain-containing protein n=1 Tax=Entamoeba invadens IP1 TaxID=370355 RepID=L7FL42_ENTIV|nr:hypothetical protein EIN_289480 [Entamoeba invadens IP1]ELP86676.1 hypothetical protein EIN_289480 [Entamoeba invadens IP1]|eukprot:XP_004186022.1 hypothetical protein EIN_289480 [Entamoeba invadens IP1]